MVSFSWTDFPEFFDDSTAAEKICFEPAIPFENGPNLQNRVSNHIFIEGDNYPVLQKLHGSFEGKIRFIYIDPPYNTGNNFTYNDDFSVPRAQEVRTPGGCTQNGRMQNSRMQAEGTQDAHTQDRHSAWLSFMSRRLNLARELLSQEGCIFIAIDQGELYHLKLLCNQIFGEDNFVNDFMWLHGKGKKDRWSRTLQQHTLCFARDKNALPPFREREFTDWAKCNPDGDPRGNWFSGSISFTESRSNPRHKNYYTVTDPDGTEWTRQWLVSREEMDALLADERIYFGQAPEYGKVPRVKIFNGTESEVIPRNIIENVESTRAAQRHLDDILGVKGAFDNPKPVGLILHLMKLCSLPKDSLVLDFFAGSGTTFEALCELNKADGGERRCILVQEPEETWQVVSGAGAGAEVSDGAERNHGVLPDSTQKIPRRGSEKAFYAGFLTIADLCWERCRRVSEKFGAKISRHTLTEANL